jgi:hypothetical protein
MIRIVFIALLFSLLSGRLESQDTLLFSVGPYSLYGIVNNGDTVFISTIQEAYISTPRKFNNNRDMRRYRKLIYNIKCVHPYAKMAGRLFRELEDTLATFTTDGQQKEYTRRVEIELKNRYEEELKNLTVTQGRILIKLIDRETGNTSYTLVQELRGNLQAFLWQTLARLFGSNLKSEFDPEGEDKLMNEIVILIETGYL